MPVPIRSYVQRTQAGAPRLVTANPDTISDAGLGNALKNLSNVLGNASDSFIRSQEEDGKAWAAAAVSDARLNWTDSITTRESQAQPGAPGFTESFLTDYNKYVEDTVKRAPTASAKKFVRERLLALRDDFGTRAIAFEAKARIDYRQDQFKTGVNNTSKLMNSDPSQYQVALAEQLAIIDASDLPPVNKSAMRQLAIDNVSQAAVWSQIQRSPSEFLTSIGFIGDGKRKNAGDLTGVTGNAAFDALPFERRTQMFESAIRLKAQIDADAEKAAKDRAKTLADEYMKEGRSRAADRKLTRDFIEQVRPFVTDTEYGSLLTALKEQSGGGSVKSDPGVYRELQQLIDKDPDEARNFAYTMHKNGRLSNEHLSQALGTVRSTDRREAPKSPYERNRSWLRDSMDPGPMVQDPVGRNRMADALYDFDTFARGGNRTEEELEKEARNITRRYKLVDFSQTVLALPQPNRNQIPRMDPATVMNAVAAATRKTMKERESGTITEAEYREEMKILKRWQEAAQNGSSARK